MFKFETLLKSVRDEEHTSHKYILPLDAVDYQQFPYPNQTF